MLKLNSLPVLATGHHPQGSGFACIMNAISYLNGDAVISDLPGCVWAPLARVAQAVNDSICGTDHVGHESVARVGGPFARLCPSCTHEMWLFGAELIGSAEVAKALTHADVFEVTTRMAGAAWSAVADMGWGSKVSEGIIRFAQRSLDVNGLRVLCESAAMSFPGLPRDSGATAYYLVQMSQLCSGPERALRPQLDDLAFDILFHCVGSLPGKSTLITAQAMVEEFKGFTGLVPIPPTQQEVDDMAVRAGLVPVG